MTRPRGRPSVFDQKQADAICVRLAEGESLRSICRDEGMPTEGTVRGWVIDDREGFASQYTRSRDLGLDCRADRLIEEARAAKDAPLGRLSFDADRWYLSKMAPKRYGDRTAVEVSGHLSMSEMSEEDIRAELAALANAGVIPATLTGEEPEEDISEFA